MTMEVIQEQFPGEKAISFKNSFQEKRLSHKNVLPLAFVRLSVAAVATVYQELQFWRIEGQGLFAVLLKMLRLNPHCNT